MRVFLLDSPIESDNIYPLKARERNYLNKVLRLEKGIVFTAKDKEENYYEATLIDEATLSLKQTENPESTLLDNLSSYKGSFTPIDMYISLLKGKKIESVVRALTEIGVRSITFVETEFVQEKAISSHQRERLDLILKEAVQQSGGKAPTLTGPIKFEEAIKSAKGIKVILHQSSRGTTKSLSDSLKDHTIDSVSLFIGPEGGFSDKECEFAEENNTTPVLLKTNILRAETASIYSASALQFYLHELA